jgi:hypothetical protein
MTRIRRIAANVAQNERLMAAVRSLGLVAAMRGGMNTLPRFGLSVLLSIVASACAEGPATGDDQFTTEIDRSFERCAFDPELGVPNPLGMRSLVTLQENDEGVIVRLERLPGNAGTGVVAATIAETRELFLADVAIDEARKMLRDEPKLYWELIECSEYCGSDESELFDTLDAALSCTRTEEPAEAFDGRAIASECGYDATVTESPNPLGMRTFLTVGGDPTNDAAVVFTVERLPAMVAVGDVPASLASRRELHVYDAGGREEARKLVADAETGLAAELLQVADESASLYAEVDAALTCR